MLGPGFSQRNNLDTRPDPFVDQAGNARDWFCIDVAKIESSGRAEIGAVRLQVFFDSRFAQRAFLHDATGMDKLRGIVRTCPRAVPASDAAIGIVVDRLEQFIFAVRPRRTMFQTKRDFAMVACKREVEQRQHRMLERVEGIDLPPGFRLNCVVLDLAGNDARLAADALVHIEDKPFSHFAFSISTSVS